MDRSAALLLGSVTAKVLHDAECPVWTATHVDRQAGAQPRGRVPNILCAVDATPKSVSRDGVGRGVCERLAGQRCGWSMSSRALRVGRNASWIANLRKLLRARRGSRSRSRCRCQGSGLPLCVAGGRVSPARFAKKRCGTTRTWWSIGRGLLDETMGRLRTHAVRDHSALRRVPVSERVRRGATDCAS